MAIKVWNGTAWVTKPVKWWNGTAWVTKPVKRWNGTAWVANEILTGAVAAPDAVSTNMSGGVVATDETTVTPSGGTAPFAYSWVRVTGSSGVTPMSPTSAATAFVANVPAMETRSATFRCTVTDALGASVQTNLVTASLGLDI